jgi:cytochrome b involved in lipid metabolism
MVKSKTLIALALAAGAAINAQSYYSLSDVRQHAKASDCWITIRGSVYDVTKYVPQHHKFDFDIAPYCGTEATNFWDKKPESGDSHSRKAEMLLKKYKIGSLKK